MCTYLFKDTLSGGIKITEKNEYKIKWHEEERGLMCLSIMLKRV